MTRDIGDRVLEFIGGDGFDIDQVRIKRIALNMDQIQQYDPPPNPAKETDSRFAAYLNRFGEESWELDALEPNVLVDLIRSEIRPLIDNEQWNARKQLTAEGVVMLEAVRSNYGDVIEFLRDRGDIPEAEVVDDEEDYE